MVTSISVVTPCLNSAPFIERTLRSVIDQRYPELEYVVADGGSTDGSLAIIDTYRGSLSQVLSEPDDGHYDALNKGFARTSGEVMGWLNSNDVYFPWTLSIVGEIFSILPEVEWLSTTLPLAVDETDRVVYSHSFPGFCVEAFRGGENMQGDPRRRTYWIQQEATFWRRSLWEKAGARLNPLVACDFELWARFFRFARLYGVAIPLAGFRLHGGQRSVALGQRYAEEAMAAFLREGGEVPSDGELRRLALGRRFLPQRWQVALGICRPRPIVVYAPDHGGWQVEHRYA